MSDWRFAPLGFCVSEVRRKNVGGREQNLLSLSYGNIVRKDIDSTEGLLPESFDTYNIVEAGDTVLRLTDLQNDQRSLRVGLVRETGIITSAYVSLRPNGDIEPRFVNYYLKNMDFRKDFYALGAGVRQSLKFDELRRIEVPVPPRALQRAIADYLDTETARIDALIAKKQRMIELLDERRGLYVRSVITGNRSVSAEDNSPKPTGPASLPDGWQWIRARFLCDVDTGSSDTDESSEDGPYPFFVRSQTPQRSRRFIFDGEAVLTAGDGAGVGKVFHHFVGRFDAHQRVYVMHHFRRVTGRFYFYTLATFFGESALDGSAKSTVDSVRRHMLTEMMVPVPPLGEQEQIVRHLDAEIERTNALVAKVAAQIDLLREHRQALITAAVTGELNIPGVAA